jgi:hypothetical protein
VDLAARAFTSVPHRVVTFVLRDARPWRPATLITAAWREWVVPGGAAEPGVAGVLFGAGDEADAIGMLVRPRHERGSARPGLFKRQVTSPAGAWAWPAATRRRATPARACAASPGAGGTRSSPLSAELAGTFCSVGINL